MNQKVTNGDVIRTLSRVASAMYLHKFYLEVFKSITEDDFATAKQDYLNLDGTEPTDRDCDVTNAIEADVLEKMNCIAIKDTGCLSIMPTDSDTLPASRDSFAYLKDKMYILNRSSSISEYAKNMEEYFMCMLG